MNIVTGDNKVGLTTSILKVADREMYCVDVHRDNGDIFEFNKMYGHIIDFFAGHADAEEP